MRRVMLDEVKVECVANRAVFSASGYGTDTHFYKGRKEATDVIECEIQGMAAEHGCDLKKNVLRWTDEWVLNSPSGEEIARWELFDK